MVTREVWQEFEGRALDPGIVVRKCLAASDHSAVFDAEYGESQPKTAAVKLISVDAASVARQLARVEAAARLSHPGLLRIFQCGLWPVHGPRVLYIVMEYAPENLAEVVSQRSLTPAEAQEALATTLNVLAYLHRHGYVHGHLTPSNILAVEDQVKISSDGLMRIGETPPLASADVYYPPEALEGSAAPPWDVWALGVTMVQLLTQQPPAWERSEPRKLLVPAALPEPFREIARNCLQDDPQRRWAVERIQARLDAGAPSQPARQLRESGVHSGARRYVMPAAGGGVALAVLLIVLGLTHDRQAEPPARAPQAAPAGKSVVKKGRPSPFENGGVSNEPGPAVPPHGQQQAGNASDGIVRRVLPKVSANARNTIRGTVRVGVAVEVDGKGNVKQARLESPGPSRYFANAAVAAARGWKFTPASPDSGDPLRSWVLRFAFRRSGTEVRPVPGRAPGR